MDGHSSSLVITEEIKKIPPPRTHDEITVAAAKDGRIPWPVARAWRWPLPAVGPGRSDAELCAQLLQEDSFSFFSFLSRRQI